MAVTAVNQASADPPAKKARKPRTPSGPKAVYAVVQILDENGNPRTDITKASVRVVSFERSADAVLSKIEGGEHPGALYLRGLLPAGR